MRRTVLGILAIVFFFGGVLLYLLGPATETSLMFSSSGIRIGLVLGAFWLAYPQLSYVPWWFVQALLVGTLVIAIRPKAALFVLPLLAAMWIVRPRKKPPRRPRKKRPPSHSER